jgi:hypothetical protein
MIATIAFCSIGLVIIVGLACFGSYLKGKGDGFKAGYQARSDDIGLILFPKSRGGYFNGMEYESANGKRKKR